jgi:hypothetical protein
MRVRLDEGILDRFVGFGRIPQVVKGDTPGPALMARDELGVAIPRVLVPSVGLCGLDGRRRRAVGLPRWDAAV